jgi:lipopolysaccharide transport system permease protein
MLGIEPLIAGICTTMKATPLFVNPAFIFQSFWKHRSLIHQLARRDVVGRYRGSVMGLLWSFFNPILMLSVYTFVFSVVFQARWGSGTDSKTGFAIVLFVGLIVYTVFSECLNRAPSLILNNVNFVKKVVFPLEILPWVAMGSTLFHATISLTVLLVFFAMVNFYLNWTAIFLPVVLLPLVVMTIGLSWFLASLGVFLRDVGQTVGLITTILMFLSPIFYPITAIPENYRPLLNLNPLSFVIEQAREVVVWGHLPNWSGLGIYFLSSLIVAWLGLSWFQKSRRAFADVL